jgi:hypothetical protein
MSVLLRRSAPAVEPDSDRATDYWLTRIRADREFAVNAEGLGSVTGLRMTYASS